MRSLLIKLVPRAALPFAERNPYLTLRQLPSKQQARTALLPPPAACRALPRRCVQRLARTRCAHGAAQTARATATAHGALTLPACLRAQVFGVAPWGGVALLGVVWMVQVRSPQRTAASRPAPGSAARKPLPSQP